ncbi:hypothetical protein MIND_00886400 [Mycena indigotica]|uniref:Ubiquitin-like protease family profile domain-containing protein n=1 Tax=Mycena indigotica TaxID=2126181 RepID=A0A8H6W1C5_9AGAR|nr:uncharacterized protein MIND_00886400 [Mycena indigotica]KAF7299371.1 hypothetical protein MIND_00886400 [Mycena indigotica]
MSAPLRPRAGRMKRLVKPTKNQEMRSAALRSKLAALLNGETPSDIQESPILQPDIVESMEWEDEVLDVAEEMPWKRHGRHFELQHMLPRPSHIPPSVHYACESGCTSLTHSTVQCLYPTHMQTVSISTCSCKSLGAILVQHGVFPSSPRRPRIGISIDLLELYRAVFERSCDAITALAHALRTVYERRGYQVLSTKQAGARASDPFRQSLTQAVLWSSNLRDRLQSRLTAVLASAEDAITSATQGATQGATQSDIDHSASMGSISSSVVLNEASHDSSATPTPLVDNNNNPQVTLQTAARTGVVHSVGTYSSILFVCFFGTDLAVSGGDIQLAGDACFSYRHLRSAGDGPTGYQPKYFIGKEKVDAVKRRMDEARRRRPAPADDGCAENWNAANEKKRVADPKRYDASGIFALTCRHSQVIFMCNIDTPGEQHHYIVALLEEVLSRLPLGSDHLASLRSFVLNAMHAYGHEWACQLLYNPRMVVGMGLTDNECIERLWSRIRKLIPITRGQWNSRRIWTIDQYAAFVNEDGFYNLSAWILRQDSKNLVAKYKAAVATLRRCGVPVTKLRVEWEEQKAAQISARRHAPKRLRRELDKVIALQAQIDAVEKSIDDVQQSIPNRAPGSTSRELLTELQATQAELQRQAEELYASLNIPGIYPALQGLAPELARLLLMMRDLKISIRKKAIGSFQEWETLDQAVSGRREPLGTKMYQATRSTITKRQPALIKALKKFNAYCSEFELLRPSDCLIPVPQPLPTQLSALRADESLHEDVWITPTEGRPPRWLDDEDVRQGIRCLHTLDRCREEALRLRMEKENLHRWLESEVRVVTYALEHCQDALVQLPLRERREYLAILGASWARGLTSTSIGNRTLDIPTLIAPTSRQDALPAPVQVELQPSDELDQDAEESPFDSPQDEMALEPDLEMLVDDTINAQETLVLEEEGGDDSPEGAETVYAFKHCDESPPVQVDTELFECLKNYVNQHPAQRSANTSCTIIDITGRKHFIDSTDLDRLLHRKRWLNNFCLNGVAAIIMQNFMSPTSSCALLSTLDLHRVQYGTDDSVLWHHLAPTLYWEKDLWLIPIHRRQQQHWVFAIASKQEQLLFIYDSFADATGWNSDLEDIMKLLAQMTKLASANGHHIPSVHSKRPWLVHPLFQAVCPPASHI